MVDNINIPFQKTSYIYHYERQSKMIKRARNSGSQGEDKFRP